MVEDRKGKRQSIHLPKLEEKVREKREYNQAF
jgi:hypothetical protein